MTFIRSTIKIITDMRTVHAKNTVTFIPPVTDDGTCKPEHGWLNVDGKSIASRTFTLLMISE